MIKLMRVDDRLIHGQCMTVLVKRFEAKDIIVIDDFTASNAMLKKIFISAVPKTMHAIPCTVKESIDLLKDAVTNDRNTIVLARVPSVYAQVYKEVEGLPKELNIASVQAKDADRYITEFAHVTAAEVDAVKQIADLGVHVYFNLVPGQTQVFEWDDLKNKF